MNICVLCRAITTNKMVSKGVYISFPQKHDVTLATVFLNDSLFVNDSLYPFTYLLVMKIWITDITF